MNLFIFKYNNYYNRILKKEDTLEAYGDPIYVYEPQSFNPNDGVDTQVLVGDFYAPYDGTGDYVILEEEGEIISRWFIIEAKFETAKAQWNLTLRRDLLVDFYDHYIDTDCFIEKATLNAEDPLLFNSEDVSFNQIKTLEYPLKDETLSAWVVGYYAKNITDDKFLKGDVKTNVPDSMYDTTIPVPFASWKYNATTRPIKIGINALDYIIKGNQFVGAAESRSYKYKFTSSGNYLGSELLKGETPSLWLANPSKAQKVISEQIKSKKTELFNEAKAYLTTETLSDSERAAFLNYNGKIIQDSTGAFYEISIYQDSLTYETVAIKSGSLFNSLKSIVTSTKDFTGTTNSSSFQVHASFNNYRMTAKKLTHLTTSWDIAPEDGEDGWKPLITEDAPYNIFAIPFDSCKLKTGIMPEDIYRSDPTYTLPIVESMIRTMGSNLYDIQLLPYCPVNYIGDNLVDVKSDSAYTLIKDASDNVVSFILHVPQTRISRNIQLEYFEIPKPESSIETKIANECEKYRLCSPNFNGYFDFSAAKNGGVQFINVDCTLKPFQPYIHLNPNFGGLYGKDFDDPRGLICGGDFSLSQYQDKWQEYQLQNKNYQEMFDRQIQNMEIQNKYQRIGEYAQAAVGTVQGAAAGFVMTGNVYGAIGGAALSGAAGLTDIAMNEKLRSEAMDYTKDMFGYQLGNIQALPYTLTKVSAFNNNNKIFPLLERYTCTDREKDAFAKKLAYNGMTTMIIDKPSKYIGNSWSRELSDGEILENKGYIKGRIIRIDTLEDEFHLLKSISDEFYKGVYIK